MKLGLKIKNLRNHRKLTREQLGEMAKISDRFIYDIETGNKGISAETLYKLSQALNVSADYLLCESKNTDDLSNIIELLKNFDKSKLKHLENWTYVNRMDRKS